MIFLCHFGTVIFNKLPSKALLKRNHQRLKSAVIFHVPIPAQVYHVLTPIRI